MRRKIETDQHVSRHQFYRERFVRLGNAADLAWHFIEV
jgi:hypothetical protein